MASSQNSLRDRQISKILNKKLGTSELTLFSGSIERMLNLNHESEESINEHHDHTASNGLAVPSAPILNSDGDPIWKVLVFDDLGRDVISSVLRVNDLRTWGVTMHMYVSVEGASDAVIELLTKLGI
jgi:hypothetical protein